MRETIPAPTAASREEVEQALAGLTDDDLVKIKRIAQMRSHGLEAIEWQDLLQEAMARALEGTRRWPADVPFVAFLAQTMRSIANEEWQRPVRRHTVVLPLAPASEASFDDGLADLGVTSVHPEREAEARDTLRYIESLFVNDSEARAILIGVAEGASPEEVRKQNGINLKSYQTAQKRIRRKLVVAFNGDS